ASVVSAAGLTLTNDHCAADCVQALSSGARDYQKAGFLAAVRTDERRCPQLVAEILTGVSDVTARMQGAGAGMSGATLVAAREAEQSRIEAEACGTDPKLRCEVVALYEGGQYKLYRYHRYADVRLVFSPGDQAAFFGGDPDNFNFPRFDLDCAFLRLYEDGKPAATPGHLRWTPRPPAAGEVVFAAGNPGGTFRDETVAQVEAQRDLVLPLNMTELAELRGRMIRFGEENAANQRLIDEPLMDVENDYKVEAGRLTALDDPAFLPAKRAAEADLRGKALGKLGPGFGDAWADMARAQAALPDVYVAYHQLEIGPRGSNLFDYARDLVRAAAERQKPSAARLPGYGEAQLPALEKAVLDPVPVEPALEQLLVEFWLSKTRERLGADDPAVRVVLGAESPEGLSQRLAAGSKLGDPAVRKALWDGGAKAIAASDDPMIQFMRRIDPEARRVRAAYEERYVGPTTRAAEAIAKARFAVLGDSVYPDGTFTLRLSYGTVAGWTYRGKTTAPFTRFAGLYDRATGAAPYDLDPRWIAARPKLDPATIFDLATTDDIIGGNSGSPLLDAKGDVIGAVFDGNILSLGGDYAFDPAVNRAVSVSALAIQDALLKVYGAEVLAHELAAP
ncbi:MAG TPA: S46 family peptidase, partial [Caulobacteraceae bacterium]|nr:S46 family peptidase [Caulobacteraceae bacterium]